MFLYLVDEYYVVFFGYFVLYNSVYEVKNVDNIKSLICERKLVEWYFVCYCVFIKVDIFFKFIF